MFRNLKNGSLKNFWSKPGPGVIAPHASRGCAFGDFDNDGDVDMVIMNLNEPPSLLRNDVKGNNHWMKVKLIGVRSNRSAIGARVTAHYGGKIQAQEVMSQSSFYSANDQRLHFGLGEVAKVDLDIRWPNGKVEKITGLDANHLFTIREGKGVIKSETFPPAPRSNKKRSCGDILHFCWRLPRPPSGGPLQDSPVDQAVVQKYEARATVVTGKVTRTRDAQPWAISAGERVPIQQVIRTGPDGFAHFEMAGGGGFDIFANSRVGFRQNAASAGDLLDVLEGRVRVHLKPDPWAASAAHSHAQCLDQRLQEATVAIAIDEDAAMRIDVLEGEVRVQHRLRPRSEPTIVRAVDAIMVRSDQQISRRLDRGSLYRYTVKPLHDLWTAVSPGHSGRSGEPIEGNHFIARFAPIPGPLQ